MPDQYLPGAERRQLDDAPMVGDGGARAGWHITWDRNATAAAPQDLVPFENLSNYFAGPGAGSAPHLLWDPFTGRIVQFFAANSRSKSFVNAPGGVETNRKGNVCIQIEILFFPHCRVNGKVYATVADTPLVGLDKIMSWLRSWGVPDVWPMGAPTWTARRDAAVWNSRSGHYGHSQVPENDHTDPGPMPNLFGAAPVQPPTQPPPAGAVLPPARVNFTRTLVNFTAGPDAREWQRYMREVRGWTGLVIDGEYGPKSAETCAAFQRDCNAHGWPLEVDGKAGRQTINAMLHRPVTKP